MTTLAIKTPNITPIGDNCLIERVLYRDGLIVVINKPTGISVHAKSPRHMSLEHYFKQLTFGLPRAPCLAHRLDHGTSGCLVLTRHKKAARRMHQLLSEGRVKKTYYAVVHGRVELDYGRIDIPLRRMSTKKTNWRMKADPGGPVSALTEFFVEQRYEQTTLLRLYPHTGRTHQLRVHCQALGHPIVGDITYGPKTKITTSLCLHARHIEIPLYEKKPPIVLSAPFPDHFQQDGLA